MKKKQGRSYIEFSTAHLPPPRQHGRERARGPLSLASGLTMLHILNRGSAGTRDERDVMAEEVSGAGLFPA